jgi:hypothetical protein
VLPRGEEFGTKELTSPARLLERAVERMALLPVRRTGRRPHRYHRIRWDSQEAEAQCYSSVREVFFFHFLFQSVHESVDPLCTVGSVPSNGWRPGGLEDLIPRETLNTILSQILMINLQGEVNHTSRKMAIGTGSKEALVPVLKSVLINRD